MKFNSTFKKFIAAMVLVYLLVGCSFGGEGGGSGNSGNAPELNGKTLADALYADWLSKVTKGEISLFAAEALVPALKRKMKETGEPLTVSAVSEQSFDLFQFRRKIVKKQNRHLEQMLLGGQSLFEGHEDELNLTLPFQSSVGNFSVTSLDRLVDLGTLKEESKRRLEAVFKIYDETAQLSAQSEALKRIREAHLDKEIEEFGQLEGASKEGKIKALMSSKKLDQVSNSGNPDVDAVVKKYITEAVFNFLMDHQKMKEAVTTGVIAAHTYEQLEKTAKAFAAFRNSVQTAWSDIKNAQNELRSGLHEINGRIPNYAISTLVHFPDKRKEWLAAVEEGRHLLEGKVDSENPNPHQAAVSEAYKKVQKSRDSLAKSTHELADAGQLLVNAGRLFLDAETVNKAQRVVDGVNKVSLIMDKLSSGGIVGVVSAVGIAMGGVGGGVDAAGARHAELSGKLDAILKNQKIMIDLQIETIELQRKTLQTIVDIAQIIDNNHRMTMARLDDMGAQLDTLTELARTEALKDFYTCDIWIAGSAIQDELKRQDALEWGTFEPLQRFETIENMLSKPGGRDHFQTCVKGIETVFLNEDKGSVVLSYRANVATSHNSQIGVDFVRLAPLKKLFGEKYEFGLESPSSRYRGLHLPAQFMSLVPFMDKVFVNQRGQAQAAGGRGYLLDQAFLNPTIVLNQTKALLEILKLTSILGEGNWTSTQPLKLGQSEQTRNIIKSAHYYVQSAIAQEVLASGEPVLSKLYDKFVDFLKYPQSASTLAEMKTGNCVSAADYERFGCLLTKNTILRRNFVQYFLHRRYSDTDVNRPDHLGAAGQANFRALLVEAQNFRNGIPSTSNLKILGGVSYSTSPTGLALQVGEVELQLPTFEEYEADQVQYSIELKDLLALEKDLIQTRMKLEDIGLTEQERQILAEFMFQAVQ
jgi:hypothetical protein